MEAFTSFSMAAEHREYPEKSIVPRDALLVAEKYLKPNTTTL